MSNGIHTVDKLYVIVDKETPHIKASEIIYEDQEVAQRACKRGQLALTLDLHITSIKTAFWKLGEGLVDSEPKEKYIPIPASYYVWDMGDNNMLVENLMEGWIAVGITDFLKFMAPVDMHYIYNGKKYDRQKTGLIPRDFSNKICCVQLYKLAE